ncbi:MAG: transposase [Terriglobia bacterium]
MLPCGPSKSPTSRANQGPPKSRGSLTGDRENPGATRRPDREPKDNPRFLITNLKQSPQWIYEQVYCERGAIENRLKELHQGLEIDCTSCSKFWANQLRVLMRAAAYVLIEELRLRAARTACARAQVGTLRERLLKLGAQVRVSVRRVVIHLPVSFPFLSSFRKIALAFGALSG